MKRALLVLLALLMAAPVAAQVTIRPTPSVSDEAYDAATWNGSLAAASKNAIRDKIETIVAGGGLGTTDIDTSAEIATIVTDETGTGALVFAGAPTFTGVPLVPDDAYAVGWNGSTAVPTKNAVYDKIETIAAGGAPTDATYLTQTANGSLSAEQAIGALATGFLGGTTTTGVIVSRVLTGTANEIGITNGDGTSGVPVWSIAAEFDLGGKTSFELPNAAAPTVDGFGELAGDNNLWAASRGAPVFYDGTGAVALLGALVSDTPTNGQVPKWNTGGTITWEDDTGGGTGAPTDATYLTQTANGSLSAEQALSTLSTGIMRVATTTGVVTSLIDSAGIFANISDETGSGVLVGATSPTLVTPVLGVATATSINKLTLTAPTTSATLTLIDGSSLITAGANAITLTSTGATGVTLPTTGTLATLAGTETLAAKTLTAPKLVDLGFLADANGNELLIGDTVASAVNEVTLANAATGNPVLLSATGGDTNVSVKLVPKGTGSVFGNQEAIIVAASDETTAITTGTAKLTFHMPYAFTLMKVKAGLTTESSSGLPAFDLNDDGVSVFTTTLTIDATEKWTDTAVTASVLTTTPLAIASGSLMTVDFDTAGTGAKGVKLYLIGYATAAP